MHVIVSFSALSLNVLINFDNEMKMIIFREKETIKKNVLWDKTSEKDNRKSTITPEQFVHATFLSLLRFDGKAMKI